MVRSPGGEREVVRGEASAGPNHFGDDPEGGDGHDEDSDSTGEEKTRFACRIESGAKQSAQTGVTTYLCCDGCRREVGAGRVAVRPAVNREERGGGRWECNQGDDE